MTNSEAILAQWRLIELQAILETEKPCVALYHFKGIPK